MDDIDELYMDIEKDKATTVKAHTRKLGTKKIKVRSSLEVAKDNFKSAKRIHKAQIKSLKRNIATHKLMIKQARNTWRLVKLSK